MRYSLASGLAMAAMFAYIAGSPFVIENLYGVSPQRFSLIFGTNAFGIVVLSQIGARLVARAGARRLLAAGLGVSLLGSLLLLASVMLGAGLAGILPAFFLIVASIGLIGPNATALALADHPQTAGSASALIGVMQYIFGAVVAPLVGLGGMATAMPLAVVIVSLSVLANAIFVIGRGHD
jgi:DHA1 family bicyclomycin/chloramphenicol resistance-like MFS transporter